MGAVTRKAWVGEMRPVTTKSLVHLVEGDVIVAGDGGRHTVTDVWLNAPMWAELVTDTGLRVGYSWDEARSAVYDVEVRGV